MKRLIVRADDLGYCEGINYGIAKSVKSGIIRTVGVMPNMPAAVHGLSLLQGEELCLGQHTNICVGKPLTDPAKIPSLVDENGYFKTSKVYRAAETDFVDLDEVILEIEAQYQRFVELTGEQPHYFEGHAVRSEAFFQGLEIVAQRHGLRYMPLPLGKKPIVVGSTKLNVISAASKPGYDPFATLKRLAESTPETDCGVMICHPGYLDAYILAHSSLTVPRTAEVEMLCAEETRMWLNEQNVQLVTYDAL